MTAFFPAVSPPLPPFSAATAPFTGGEEGYNCYRIPAITRLPDGSLLVFAEGRKFTCADHDWNDIVMKRSRDNGRTWSKLSVSPH